MNTTDIIEKAKQHLAEIDAERTKLVAMIAAAEGKPNEQPASIVITTPAACPNCCPHCKPFVQSAPPVVIMPLVPQWVPGTIICDGAPAATTMGGGGTLTYGSLSAFDTAQQVEQFVRLCDTTASFSVS